MSHGIADCWLPIADWRLFSSQDSSENRQLNLAMVSVATTPELFEMQSAIGNRQSPIDCVRFTFKQKGREACRQTAS